MKSTDTIFILNLSLCHEDTVLHLHSSPRAVVRPIQFAILAQLGQDLCGLHWIPPNIVTMATEKTSSLRVTRIQALSKTSKTRLLQCIKSQYGEFTT